MKYEVTGEHDNQRPLEFSPDVVSALGRMPLQADQLLVEEQVEQDHGSTNSLFDVIIDPEIRDNLLTDYMEAKDLFSLIGVSVPTLDEINRSRVALEQYESIILDGTVPYAKLVLAPGLGTKVWQRLYDSLRPNSLRIDQGVVTQWANLDFLLLLASTSIKTQYFGHWTMRLISTDYEPDEKNNDEENITDAHIGIYPTVNEYLTMQALYIKAGETPLDIDKKTWLSRPSGPWGHVFGKYDDKKQAVRLINQSGLGGFRQLKGTYRETAGPSK